MVVRRSKAQNGGGVGKVVDVPLHDAARKRFLNYAVSVITARALPDVRDGLKPVQRRILYTMYHDLRLTPEKSTLKCAKVVGQVLGNYHPHGDKAVYDALVRMAQPWSMRYPLIFGQGNFGSLDGDGAAAYRYTEARLLPLAVEFCRELGQETVDFHSNFDETSEEPDVLPVSFPHLLANGCTGIAVGVASNIPPHNLRELCEACILLIERRQDGGVDMLELMKVLKGPDFPTGGKILEDRMTLADIYTSGQGKLRIQGEYRVEDKAGKRTTIVITSLPYQVNKAELVEEIGRLILGRKVPQLLDVRDESTDKIRVVLECKRGCDVDTVMAYLYKHTKLQTNFHVNLTCLVPTEEGRTRPERLGVLEILQHFNRFRFQVVRRRITYELRLLRERIHILEGLCKVFSALDEAIAIIRASEGRREAADALRKRFALDQLQVDAVLDLRLYKLGRADIRSVKQELIDKKKQATRWEKLLRSEAKLWEVVKNELRELADNFGDRRRTKILERGAKELDYQDFDFILDEEVKVILTRDGWVKRAAKHTDPSKVRLRPGDELVTVLDCRTVDSVVFFSNKGIAYTILVNELPDPGRGYGVPLQKLFSFSDGEKAVAVLPWGRNFKKEGDYLCLALSSDGYGFKFGLDAWGDLPGGRCKKKRKFMNLNSGAEVVDVRPVVPGGTLIVVSRLGRALLCNEAQIQRFFNAAKGRVVMRLGDSDQVLGFKVVLSEAEGIKVRRKESGKEIMIGPGKYKPASRGGRGYQVIKRGELELVSEPLEREIHPIAMLHREDEGDEFRQGELF